MKKAKKIRKVAKKRLTRIRVDSYSEAMTGAGIKFYRVAKGLSQSQAAAKLGWTTQRWSDIENGRHPNPRVGTLLAICEVLGCSVDEILKYE